MVTLSLYWPFLFLINFSLELIYNFWAGDFLKCGWESQCHLHLSCQKSILKILLFKDVTWYLRGMIFKGVPNLNHSQAQTSLWVKILRQMGLLHTYHPDIVKYTTDLCGGPTLCQVRINGYNRFWDLWSLFLWYKLTR